MSEVYTQQRLAAMAESRRATYCVSLCKQIMDDFLKSSAFVNFRPWTTTYTLEFDIGALAIFNELRKTFPDISINVYPNGIDTIKNLPRMAVWIHPNSLLKPEDA